MEIVIIGCGLIGAAIAYELSQVSGLSVTVFDKNPPLPPHSKEGQETSTAAALGVLMGVISHKIKGKAWRMRATSIERYKTLIPELEAITGKHIQFNSQGILLLCNPDEDLAKWESLIKVRESQGWRLELWDNEQVKSHCPQLDATQFDKAIYSPQDCQLDPVALTLALIEASQKNGVKFEFGVAVSEILSETQIQTARGIVNCDRLIIAAGLGSAQLTAAFPKPVTIKPVLGQAVHYRGKILGNPDFQPSITGNDVHLVPVGKGDYWVGATVEPPTESGEVIADPALLDLVIQKVQTYCPALTELNMINTWVGLRPRPEGEAAPVIKPVTGYEKIWLATAHYRNGILLAPATAITIREAIVQ